MRQYESAELFEDCGRYYLLLEGHTYDAIVGKHCVWVPEAELKIIWTHCGRVESFRDWEKGRNRNDMIGGTFPPRIGYNSESKRSIINEYAIMTKLAESRLAPPIGKMVYIRQFTSRYPYGVEFCDVRGRYGYVMADATALPEGKFKKGSMREVFGDSLVASDDAIGDLYKPSNMVNGYLVDVRRTIWDMIEWRDVNHEIYEPIFDIRYDVGDIKRRVQQLGQFPYRERSQPYEDYFIGKEWVSGSRNTRYRADFMGLKRRNVEGRSFLDMGCCIGSMLNEAYRKGGVKLLGFDHQKEYIQCARDIAMVNSYPINFVVLDLMDIDAVSYCVNEFYCHRVVDVVLALSLFKHVKFALFELLQRFSWRVCYVESNNAPDGLDSDHAKQVIRGIDRLKSKWRGLVVDYMGQTTDRSPRCVWRLERV